MGALEALKPHAFVWADYRLFVRYDPEGPIAKKQAKAAWSATEIDAEGKIPDRFRDKKPLMGEI